MFFSIFPYPRLPVTFHGENIGCLPLQVRSSIVSMHSGLFSPGLRNCYASSRLAFSIKNPWHHFPRMFEVQLHLWTKTQKRGISIVSLQWLELKPDRDGLTYSVPRRRLSHLSPSWASSAWPLVAGDAAARLVPASPTWVSRSPVFGSVPPDMWAGRSRWWCVGSSRTAYVIRGIPSPCHSSTESAFGTNLCILLIPGTDHTMKNWCDLNLTFHAHIYQHS